MSSDSRDPRQPSSLSQYTDQRRHRRVFTAREASVKLGVDAKTLRAWRACPLCNISPRESPADARLALYTLDDLKTIARHHGRTLRDDDAVAKEAHSPSRRELLSRLEHAEAQLTYAMNLLGQSPANRAPDRQPVEQQTLLHDGPPTGPLPTLDNGLVPWRAMARFHGIPETTVAKAVEERRLPAIPGNWQLGRQIVKGALDAAGQARFYQLWHRSPRFVACPACPHGANGTSGGTSGSTTLLHEAAHEAAHHMLADEG